MDGFLNESPRAHAESSGQNREFSKILDGDPTKITIMSRKIDELEAIAEKQ